MKHCTLLVWIKAEVPSIPLLLLICPSKKGWASAAFSNLTRKKKGKRNFTGL